MTVAAQEVFDAKSSRAIIRADKNDVSDTPRDQLHSAKDERPHEYLAQFAVCLHERKQLRAIDFDQLTRLADTYLSKSPPAREHVYLACKHPWTKDGDGFRGWIIGPNDFDLTGNKDEQARGRLTRFDQNLPTLDLPRAAMGSDSRDLGCV